MRSESFILINDNIRNKAIQRVLEIICDGKTKLTISDAGSKTARQRGLQWLWYSEVVNAGIGGFYEDTKEKIHIISKYRFALPILIRDDDLFSSLYDSFCSGRDNERERRLWFVENQVHTESMSTSQMAEFLTDFQRYYLDKGISLTNPDDIKILQY